MTMMSSRVSLDRVYDRSDEYFSIPSEAPLHCFHGYPTTEKPSGSISCSLQDDQANSKAGKPAFHVVW